MCTTFRHLLTKKCTTSITFPSIISFATNNYILGGFGVIKMVQYDYIRDLYFNEGLSQRTIAKRLMIHRETVKRAIMRDHNTYQRQQPKEKPINGDFISKVKAMLIENKSKPRKQRLTKTRMFTLMQDEGYMGCYSSFTELTRQLEEELSLTQEDAFIKLLPTEGTMQVDFGEMNAIYQGKKTKVIAFCAKLKSSKCEFVVGFPKQSTEYFLEGLNRAFQFFGGIPRKIVFDNLKQAVKEIKPDGERVLQDAFLKFKAYYSFNAVFCNPASGHEKGMIENLVKYTRNNYFLPTLEFNSYDELNTLLINACQKRMHTQKVKGTPWNELLEEERLHAFMPLKDLYDIAKITTAKVDSYALVSCDTNHYSVPTKYVGKQVFIKMYPFEVQIAYENHIIAKHKRLLGKHEEILNPYHYLPLLAKKPGAIEDAKFMQDWHLPPIFETYHKQLQARSRSKSAGTREYIKILQLTEHHGINKIAHFLKDLSQKNNYSFEEVKSYIRFKQTDKRHSEKPMPDIPLEALNVVSITAPPSMYDSLLTGGTYTNE